MSDSIPDVASRLRATIDRAKVADAPIAWLSRFPRDCCNLAANLLLFDLSLAGVSKLRRLIAHVPCDNSSRPRHVWVEADEFVVDITADQFGQEPVIAAPHSVWHESLLGVEPYVPRHDAPEGISGEEIARLKRAFKNYMDELESYR